MARRDLASAQALLRDALVAFPGSIELRRAQAGWLQQTGRGDEAAPVLRALLAEQPGDAASAFPLARMLQGEGANAAAAAILRDCVAAGSNPADTNLAIAAIELLADSNRQRDASAIAEAALAAHPEDTRLHAYAGMLDIQLGEFDRAREHYLSAWRDPRAAEWHVALGLSSTLRYDDPAHPDLALFRAALDRSDLSGLARAELHFALGKAHDDLAAYAAAAQHFRAGNAIRKPLAKWSRKPWRRAIEARLAAPPIKPATAPMDDFTPVFIVGMPRSGTTLLAELLSRHPRVCNRGELSVLASIAQQPPPRQADAGEFLRRAAYRYMCQSRQDDAPGARWFIDKQPLNFRYVDLALALFPDAKIIHCQRGARDNALSLWQQCFLEDVQGYSCDFADIAVVMRDCGRLMEHWCTLHPDSVRTQHYEDIVAAPEATALSLAAWIGLPAAPPANARTDPPPQTTINTASLWQARQPVHSRSIGRWRHYAEQVPELLRFSA